MKEFIFDRLFLYLGGLSFARFEVKTYRRQGGKTMRILFEVLLLSIVIGAVVLFYKIFINYLFPKKKEKNDGDQSDGR
jgi:hypothetical protein